MTRERIPALDGWRGMAILLVLAGHCQYALMGKDPLILGSHGIVLFFVLSGFLITRKLLAEKREGPIQLRKFYRRRVRRLLPAAWTFLAVAAIILAVRHLEISKLEFLSSVLCFRNYVDPQGITGHFWSLSIEEQFYIVWALLMCLLPRKALIVSALGLAGLLLVGRVHGWVLFPNAGWYRFHTEACANPLLFGCLAALVEDQIAPWLTGIPLWPFLIVYVIQLLRDPMPSFGESLVIGIMLLLSTRANMLLSWTPLRWIGLISYSLYLWQEPFLMDRAHVNSIPALLARLFGLSCAAALSWYLLEPNPYRRIARDPNAPPSSGERTIRSTS